MRIYIPIWLDLLSRFLDIPAAFISDLHSNMVRFIIREYKIRNYKTVLFTFQYG